MLHFVERGKPGRCLAADARELPLPSRSAAAEDYVRALRAIFMKQQGAPLQLRAQVPRVCPSAALLTDGTDRRHGGNRYGAAGGGGASRQGREVGAQDGCFCRGQGIGSFCHAISHSCFSLPASSGIMRP